jgi:hypothetical protein
VKDQLVAFKNPQTKELVQIRRSEMNRSAWRAAMSDLLKDPDTLTRDVEDYKVQWFKIAGCEIIDRKDWAGRYVPIIRVPGEETVIDGEMDRKGHVRALKDAQRMYNYNASAQVEFGALQNKIPYIAPAAAIEGYETYWESANTQNYSVLPWNHADDEGRTDPGPEAPGAAEREPGLSARHDQRRQRHDAGLGPVPGRLRRAVQRALRRGDPAAPAAGRDGHLPLHRPPRDGAALRRQDHHRPGAEASTTPSG